VRGFRLKPHPSLTKTIRTGLALLLIFGVAMAVIAARIEPIVRDRAIAALESRFDSDVELQTLKVSLVNHITVHGEGLVLRHHGRRDVPPLIEIHQFSASLSWAGLFGRPFHVREVHLEGLVIHIPPKQQRLADERPSQKRRDIPLLVDDLTSDNAELDLLPGDPNKDPHVFLIHRLVMHSVGLGHSAPFESRLTNALPPGEIDVKGHFGPWQGEDPGQTPLSADYNFHDADLSVFHGIAGILSSNGSFGGVLEDIDVHGNTTVPDFTITVAGHPLKLDTDFSATVDGTNGNTLLHPVIAHFRNSTLICNGGVVKTPGAKGREIALEVTTDHARLEDLMLFAVKSSTSPMTGNIRLTTKFDLPPGREDIADRLRLDGTFGIGGAQFASEEIRSKLESLSRRGQGKPEDVDAGNAISELKGTFTMRNGQVTFRDLSFSVTGATVELAGSYGLKTEQLDFHGKLHLQAKLSQVTTGVKSFLLKPFDPFFRKDGETVLPIRITGTREQPSFGLDFHRKSDKDESRRLRDNDSPPRNPETFSLASDRNAR
jgi:AsmA-like C-terminal region